MTDHTYRGIRRSYGDNRSVYTAFCASCGWSGECRETESAAADDLKGHEGEGATMPEPIPATCETGSVSAAFKTELGITYAVAYELGDEYVRVTINDGPEVGLPTWLFKATGALVDRAKFIEGVVME